MKPLKTTTIIFDNQCRLCNMAVRLLTGHGHSDHFNCIPATDRISQEFLMKRKLEKDLIHKTVIVVEEDQFYIKSSAVIRTLQKKGGIWKLFGIFQLIPEIIRDKLYDLVARFR
jgi:predicted DCC family thiol-disulfide oxidoreductase YuxK